MEIHWGKSWWSLTHIVILILCEKSLNNQITDHHSLSDCDITIDNDDGKIFQVTIMKILLEITKRR